MQKCSCSVYSQLLNLARVRPCKTSWSLFREVGITPLVHSMHT
jgi:hypothetical protein